MEEIKRLYNMLYNAINTNCQAGRERSLAITKLQEAQFWAMSSLEIDKKLDSENNKKNEYRICSDCGKKMDHGYVIHDGECYYCSDECLKKHMTISEYLDQYENGIGDSYYTEWN